MEKVLDINGVPQHIAIIMDGNGRWAAKQGKNRSFGHQAGVETVKRIINECIRLGVKYLTLYTFSTENWSRPKKEIEGLFNLIRITDMKKLFNDGKIHFKIIGDKKRLPADIQDKLAEAEEDTKNNSQIVLTIALSYSSRWELTKAVKDICREVKENKLSLEDISEKTIEDHLETASVPDPDLLIRTGGEVRLSNYLLWQLAYSELYFCDTFWPDFTEKELREAILNFDNRQRRFGKTGEQVLKENNSSNG